MLDHSGRHPEMRCLLMVPLMGERRITVKLAQEAAVRLVACFLLGPHDSGFLTSLLLIRPQRAVNARALNGTAHLTSHAALNEPNPRLNFTVAAISVPTVFKLPFHEQIIKHPVPDC